MDPSDSDDEDQLDEEAFRRKVFGRFVVAGNGDDCEDQTFEVFGGENKIGRDPDQSNIAIDNRVTFCSAARHSPGPDPIKLFSA